MSVTQSTWSGVFQNIVSNVQEIVRSEVRLAKTEIKEEAQKAAEASVTLGIGAVLAFYATGFLLLCVVSALSLVLPVWAATLIVGAVLGLAALLFISSGWRRMSRVQTKPVQTIESLKETVQWAQNQRN